MKLNYIKMGEGQPLVILHGLFGLLDNWKSLGNRFAEHYEVYLVDQRNHGRSFHSEEFNYEVLAEDLNNFVEDLGLENPIILGHSMGGKTAMEFAVRYPEKLSKLIVVDISVREYEVHHQSILAGLNAVDFQNVKTRGQADKQMAEHIDNLGVRQFLLKNLYRNSEKKFAWRINLPVLTRTIGEIVAGISSSKSQSTESLFIRGLNSDYILDSDEDLIKSTFSEAEFVRINAGHWVHAEKPNELFDAVKSFIGN